MPLTSQSSYPLQREAMNGGKKKDKKDDEAAEKQRAMLEAALTRKGK